MEHLFIISMKKYEEFLKLLAQESKYLPKMKALLKRKSFEDK